MYEKCFSKTIATIATLQVNQLVFSYLSVAIRAFSIITYCHLLPRLVFAYSSVNFSESNSCLICGIKTGISFSMIFQSCLGFIV